MILSTFKSNLKTMLMRTRHVNAQRGITPLAKAIARSFHSVGFLEKKEIQMLVGD